jgi:CBS domain containing-hemolysin-like protein
VDVVAVSEDATATEVLRVATATKYSRLPVFRASVDDIVGVLFSKVLRTHVPYSVYSRVYVC